CPGDISVVSFDGIVPPDLTAPQLTSVVQPVTEVGERAVRLLTTVIAGASTPEHVVFPTELAVRESCGATPTAEPEA
ncbi:MAG: LacI family transcriptional regulator, partial [Acidimicrobiaceae bacterium]|nr:LacI family transcriptional regulator [Acidimicrobiaceae bacterium]